MGRVVVLGASTTDMNMRLPRLPKAGQTLHGEFVTAPGGKGANQAVAARRAGAEVVFLTAFGDDAFAGPIRRHDEAEGIDLTYAKTVPGASSGVAMIFVADDGENLIGIAMGANARLGPEDIDALPESVFDPPGVLLASLEVPVETVARAVERAHRSGMTVVVNPAPGDRRLADLGCLPRIDVLTPNESEAEILPGRHLDAPAAAADALRAEGVKAVVLTLGGRGCLVVDDAGPTAIPAAEGRGRRYRRRGGCLQRGAGRGAFRGACLESRRLVGRGRRGDRRHEAGRAGPCPPARASDRFTSGASDPGSPGGSRGQGRAWGILIAATGNQRRSTRRTAHVRPASSLYPRPYRLPPIDRPPLRRRPPRRPAPQDALGRHGPARDGRDEPAARHRDGDPRPPGRRQRRRRRHRRQCRARPRRADLLRDRRRPVRDRLGREDAEALRPQRQRSRPARGDDRAVSIEGIPGHPQQRPVLVVRPRLRERLGSPPQQVRDEAVLGHARPGDRLC